MSKPDKPKRRGKDEPAPHGRPLAYTAAIADLICRRLAAGESLRAICRSEEMPSEAAVRSWALDDRDGFSARYARARELQAHSLADEMAEIADDGSNDWMMRTGKDDAPGYELNGEHVQRSRLRVDTRKWLLAKMLPKVYGERLHLDAKIDLNPDDVSDAELAAIARAAAAKE